ncbi:hypothetical protein FRC17_009104 [Serendipita sp. 399]|nr:hypothetical protein FRC17_009104 [Serendipita sp. 399]
MANPNYPYQLDGFGDMQQNTAHQLTPQHSIGGVPASYANGWNNLSETFRSQNATPGGQAGAAAAVLQMHQQQPGIHSAMNLVGNQGMQPQLGRPTPRMQPQPINPSANFRGQPSAQIPQNYAPPSVNSNPPNINANHLMAMGRGGANLIPGTNGNIQPALARQLENLNSGHTGGGVLGPPRPSISNPTAQHQTPWSVTILQFQRKLQECRDQAQVAARNASAAQLQQVRDDLVMMTNTLQMEAGKLAKSMAGVPPERIPAILKPFEDLSAQYQSLYKSVDEHIRKSQIQPNGANVMGMNMMPTGNRMTPSQPWDLQRTINQTPTVPDPSNLSHVQKHGTVQPNFPTNMAIPGNSNGNLQQRAAQANQENRMKFNALLARISMDQVLNIQGHPIETFQLYQYSVIFDKNNPPTHPQKFRLIGAQLGLPAESGLASIPVADLLQQHTARIVRALDQMARMQKSQMANSAAPTLPSNAVANDLLLNRAKQAQPHINFNEFTPDVVNNLLPAVFEDRIQRHILQQTAVGAFATNAAPRPPSTKPPQAPSPHPPHQQVPPQRPISAMGINVQEILKRHDECRRRWQGELRNMQMQEGSDRVEGPGPDAFPAWRTALAAAFTSVRQLIPSMGFYYYISNNEDEMRQLIHASLRVAKQMSLIQPAPTTFILSLRELEEITSFLRPRAESYVNRLASMPNLPPEIATLTHPSEADLRSLCGLMPQHRPIPPQYAPAQTPINVPAPTPPAHLPNVPQPSIGIQRHNGFIDPSTSSPHHVPPAPAPVVAPTPPSAAAAASPSKPKAPPRTRVPKKKASKAANTPTPSAEPASTPTPTASAGGIKRSHDEAETPAAQSEVPPIKKMKMEAATPILPAAPVAPVKPPSPIKPSTPPPQISPPVDRSTIQSAAQATELLAEAVKRAEEQDAVAQAQGQNPADLFQWLSQLLSGSPIAAPPSMPTPAAPAANDEQPTGEADPVGDIEFFDWGNYYSEQEGATVPELDKHTTVSPESHNNDITTTTPPSQTTTPAQRTSKATTTLAEKDVSAQSSSRPPNSSVGMLPDSEFALTETGLFSPSGFPFDRSIEPWDDPWGAIA